MVESTYLIIIPGFLNPTPVSIMQVAVGNRPVLEGNDVL